MLLDDLNQPGFVYVVIPHAVGINRQDRPTAAYAQARRDSPFHPFGIVVAAQIAKQARQLFIELIRPSAGIAKRPRAEKDVPGIRCHLRRLVPDLSSVPHRVFLQNNNPVRDSYRGRKTRQRNLAWKDRLAIFIPCPSPRRTELNDQDGRPDFTNFLNRSLCYSCGAVLDWSEN